MERDYNTSRNESQFIASFLNQNFNKGSKNPLFELRDYKGILTAILKGRIDACQMNLDSAIKHKNTDSVFYRESESRMNAFKDIVQDMESLKDD